MEKQFLLPHKYKKAGWVIYLVAAGLAILFIVLTGILLLTSDLCAAIKGQEEINLTGVSKGILITIGVLLVTAMVLFVIGCLLVAVSKEKIEDEFILKLRKSAFLNAVLYNYVLLMLLYFWLPEPSFLKFFGHSIFNILVMYIFDFHIRLNYQDSIDELENRIKKKRTRNAK
jgi:hypothetical protein